MPPFEVPNPDLGPLPITASKRAGWHWHPTPTEQRLTDTETFLRMPATLRAEHAAMMRGLTADPTRTPCPWLGGDGRCVNYEYRPAVCRDWPVGNVGCHQARGGRGYVAWRHDNPPEDWYNPRRDPPSAKIMATPITDGTKEATG